MTVAAIIIPGSSAKYQCLAALVVAILSLCFGLSIGWASPSMILYKTHESPLPSGPMGDDAISWIAALFAVGSLIGNLFYGYIINKFGRKLSLLSMSLPSIMSWLFVLFAQNNYYLYFARLLHGFVAGGVVVAGPIFLIEIASDRIRGALGSTVLLSSNAGILAAYIMGTFCAFVTTPVIVIVLIALFTIVFYLFPESPHFLIKQNKITEAEKAVQFYHNIPKGEYLQYEIERLQFLVNGSETKKTSVKWSDFVTAPGRKAMTIGIVLSSLNQISGCFALLNYAGIIFEESGSKLSPNVSTIIVGILLLIGTSSLMCMVERFGRKFLYTVSTVGSTLGFITLGVYLTLKSREYNVESFNWIPLVSYSLTVFFGSCAVLTLPFTVIGEIMPENIKDIGVTICNTILSLFGFIILKFLPNLTALIGLHGMMFLFAAICLASAVFIIFCMPETKGKSYEQIMNSLR